MPGTRRDRPHRETPENYNIFSILRGTVGWELSLTGFALDKLGLFARQ
jgi:hypothetical protein